jgi:hypothetical protein
MRILNLSIFLFLFGCSSVCFSTKYFASDIMQEKGTIICKSFKHVEYKRMFNSVIVPIYVVHINWKYKRYDSQFEVTTEQFLKLKEGQQVNVFFKATYALCGNYKDVLRAKLVGISIDE